MIQYILLFSHLIVIVLRLKCLRLLSQSNLSNETYHDEQHEVDPVPERMSVLDVIHYVHPSFQADDLESKNKLIFLSAFIQAVQNS